MQALKRFEANQGNRHGDNIEPGGCGGAVGASSTGGQQGTSSTVTKLRFGVMECSECLTRRRPTKDIFIRDNVEIGGAGVEVSVASAGGQQGPSATMTKLRFRVQAVSASSTGVQRIRDNIEILGCGAQWVPQVLEANEGLRRLTKQNGKRLNVGANNSVRVSTNKCVTLVAIL